MRKLRKELDTDRRPSVAVQPQLLKLSGAEEVGKNFDDRTTAVLRDAQSTADGREEVCIEDQNYFGHHL